MWLEKILESTSELESPKQFWYWSLLCAMSAVLKDSVFIDRYAYLLYPNIYVLLVGKSGIRKGPPVALASDLVRRVGNTRVIEGRSSFQAILKDLASVHTNGNGKSITDSCGFIVNDEFSAAIVDDDAAMKALTTLYDRQYHEAEMTVSLVSRRDKLKKPTVSLLSASNPTLLKDLVTHREIKGGFVGRTFIIIANKRNTINALTRPLKVKLDRDEAAKYLEEVAKLRGPFDWTDEARDLYEPWYEELCKEDSTDETGTVERIGDHVIKVAMLLHLTRELTLRLEAQDIEDAMEACSPFISNAANVTLGQGNNKVAVDGAEILKQLVYEKKISRRDLLRKHWANMNAMEFDQVMDVFIQAGYVQEDIEKGVKYYYIADKVIEQYLMYKKS